VNWTALLNRLTEAEHQGTVLALATVINTSHSVPRHAGSKMLVYADGTQFGTVGGGELESRVINESLAALDDQQPRVVTYDLLDPGNGDPGVCGGSVDVYIEPHLPAPQLIVVGCGHIGAAVVDLGHWLGFEVLATDDRDDDRIAEAASKAKTFIAGPIESLIDSVVIRADASIIVVSRNLEVDLAAIPKLLATKARFVGVMGSLRRCRTTRERLIELGVNSDDLARLHAPIGLELNAETPEEIAVSIMAEVISHTRGGDGSPMTDIEDR